MAATLTSDLEHQHLTLRQLHIDRASLASTLVSERSAELDTFYKAWLVRSRAFFAKTAFAADWERQVLRCPQGIEMLCQAGQTVHCSTETCAACPQRVDCTRSSRSITLCAEEALLQELRTRRGTSADRATLWEWVGVEHDLAHIDYWQEERARYRGVRKNLLGLPAVPS